MPTKRSRGTGLDPNLDLGLRDLIPRRSHRLMLKSELEQPSLPYPQSDSGIGYGSGMCYSDIKEDDVERANRSRKNRMNVVKDFRKCYRYGPRKDKKTCVWSSKTCSWLDKSSGMTWVAVHGTNTICVVTKREDKVDRKRAFNFMYTFDIEVLQRFRESIAFEVEDLAYPSSGSRRLSDLDHIVRPFGVVSVLPGTDKVDEENAVSYLEEMMGSGKDFSLNQTIHTAIMAFQILLRRRTLTEEEIQVCTWKGQDYACHMSRSVIKKHLSAMYGGGSPDITAGP